MLLEGEGRVAVAHKCMLVRCGSESTAFVCIGTRSNFQHCPIQHSVPPLLLLCKHGSMLGIYVRWTHDVLLRSDSIRPPLSNTEP